MKILIPKILRVASRTTIVCMVLGTGSLVWAQTDNLARGDDEERCSNRTLRGDYGFAVEGSILPAPGIALPIRGVALTHFDGKGNLTQVDHVVFNGLPPAQEWTPGTGSYHIDGNCTGTVRIDVPSTGDFVNLRIVVVRDGKEIHTVVTSPFRGPARAVTSVGIKVD